MDESNPQTQNPNISLDTPSLSQGQPMIDHIMKKKGHWSLVAVVMVLLAVFFVGWWYTSQMAIEPVIQQPQVNQEAREDTMINKDIQEANLGDLDVEFQAVDSDLNSL